MRIFFSMVILFYNFLINACPLCVGTVEQNSPPFFSDECYTCNITSYDFKSTGTQNTDSDND